VSVGVLRSEPTGGVVRRCCSGCRDGGAVEWRPEIRARLTGRAHVFSPRTTAGLVTWIGASPGRCVDSTSAGNVLLGGINHLGASRGIHHGTCRGVCPGVAALVFPPVSSGEAFMRSHSDGRPGGGVVIHREWVYRRLCLPRHGCRCIVGQRQVRAVTAAAVAPYRDGGLRSIGQLSRTVPV